jgi:hypothetical protein
MHWRAGGVSLPMVLVATTPPISPRCLHCALGGESQSALARQVRVPLFWFRLSVDDNPYRPPSPPPPNPTLPVLWRILSFVVIGVICLPLACVAGIGGTAFVAESLVAHEQSKHPGVYRDSDNLAGWQSDLTLYAAIGGFASAAIGMPLVIYTIMARNGSLLAIVRYIQSQQEQSRGTRNSAPEDNVAGVRDRGLSRRSESDGGIRMQ